MATYPVEFHRRLEQKWESRIEQILSVTGKVPPPRGPNDDDDEMQTVPKFHRGPLGWRTPEGTYNDRPFIEALHCPKHCSYNTPPPSEVIGVSALAHPDLIIEIVAIAALPD